MELFETIVICTIAISALVLLAGMLSHAHAPERKACIEAGHEWSATKYVCVAKLKK